MFGFFNLFVKRKERMTLILIMTTALAVLTSTEAGLLGQRGRSHLNLPFEGSGTGGICLNGGTIISFMDSRAKTFCICPDGFSGRHCEIDTSSTCYSGLGLTYRGTVSRSKSGLQCVEWDSDIKKRLMGSDVFAGRHNYCRNLELRRAPWCYVMKGHQLVQEYCDIPRCGSETSFHPTDPPEYQPTKPNMVSTCGQRTRGQLKIVGGTAETVESHPWIAAIFWRSRSQGRVFRCGGSLISPCWVLTAAHCFPDSSFAKAHRFSVTLGKNAINETDDALEQTFMVEEVIVHANFDNSEGNFNNDIALLKLKARRGQCAEATRSVRPVCLPPAGQTLNLGVSCEIAGYGKEREGLWYNSQYLRQAKVNLIAQRVCRRTKYYGNMITNNMFCAGVPDWSRDACKGDSGGPLVCEVNDRLFLFGIISWGDGCARENRPGVYTTVTNYNQWIEEKTGLLSISSGSMFPLK